MDISLDILAQWLKNSVFGILLLGAMGSLLAVGILTFLRKLLLEFIPDRYKAIRYLLIRRSYVSGFILGNLAGKYEKSHSIEGYFVYFSYLLARLIISASLLILIFIIFIYSLNNATSQLLTYSSFASAFLCFFLMIDINGTANILFKSYEYLVEPILKKAEKTYETPRVQKAIFKEPKDGQLAEAADEKTSKQKKLSKAARK